MSPTRRLTIVVPAYNEAKYLQSTLDSLHEAVGAILADWTCAVVVVDDQSTDGTADLARRLGAHVVGGEGRGIGAARNRGAAEADGDLVVFVDADTLVPATTLATIVQMYEDEGVLAASIPGEYTTDRWILRPLLAWWRWHAPRHNSTQGIFQAYHLPLFDRLGGFDERLHMAEDTDLFDRAMSQLESAEWRIVNELRVAPSMRRYEQSNARSLWLLTNPITTKYLRRNKRVWRRWYENPPR